MLTEVWRVINNLEERRGGASDIREREDSATAEGVRETHFRPFGTNDPLNVSIAVWWGEEERADRRTLIQRILKYLIPIVSRGFGNRKRNGAPRKGTNARSGIETRLGVRRALLKGPYLSLAILGRMARTSWGIIRNPTGGNSDFEDGRCEIANSRPRQTGGEYTYPLSHAIIS